MPPFVVKEIDTSNFTSSYIHSPALMLAIELAKKVEKITDEEKQRLIDLITQEQKDAQTLDRTKNLLAKIQTALDNKDTIKTKLTYLLRTYSAVTLKEDVLDPEERFLIPLMSLSLNGKPVFDIPEPADFQARVEITTSIIQELCETEPQYKPIVRRLLKLNDSAEFNSSSSIFKAIHTRNNTESLENLLKEIDTALRNEVQDSKATYPLNAYKDKIAEYSFDQFKQLNNISSAEQAKNLLIKKLTEAGVSISQVNYVFFVMLSNQARQETAMPATNFLNTFGASMIKPQISYELNLKKSNELECAIITTSGLRIGTNTATGATTKTVATAIIPKNASPSQEGYPGTFYESCTPTITSQIIADPKALFDELAAPIITGDSKISTLAKLPTDAKIKILPMIVQHYNKSKGEDIEERELAVANAKFRLGMGLHDNEVQMICNEQTSPSERSKVKLMFQKDLSPEEIMALHEDQRIKYDPRYQRISDREYRYALFATTQKKNLLDRFMHLVDIVVDTLGRRKRPTFAEESKALETTSLPQHPHTDAEAALQAQLKAHDPGNPPYTPNPEAHGKQSITTPSQQHQTVGKF